MAMLSIYHSQVYWTLSKGSNQWTCIFRMAIMNLPSQYTCIPFQVAYYLYGYFLELLMKLMRL
ncbi:unnamed protein product [Acanthoscelides obtectus]|uniref:Uncharacterized protein n=1 Tax=Acanthoscelides obtectus TaxID=200917 RepID=A0A9P0K1T1_ACAOB|nr:unnamed protein product [Acanthoscelides obtectus]CAK1658672.1 hypothetical protein AOBTE_LOCUS21059 [Acanthoscelides obtectus]